MKHPFLLFLLFLCFAVSSLKAQTFSHDDDNLLYDSASIAQRAQLANYYHKHINYYYNFNISQTQSLLPAASRYTIPVVFHVFNNGVTGNISDAQIDSQMAALNRAYDPAQIRFVLAKRKPDGTSFSGINRYNIPNRTDYPNKAAAFSILDSIEYPACKYLNIMVIDTLYDNSPSQLIIGTATFPNSANYFKIGGYDGVITSFWTIGSSYSSFGNPYQFNGGIVLVHEIGHYLNLFHPFTAGNNCTFYPTDSAKQYNDGDYCWDTPPCKDTLGFDSCGIYNTCYDHYFHNTSNVLYDAYDPVHNYMMYKIDACRYEFTQDQIRRMWATLDLLRRELWSNKNLADLAINDDDQPRFYVVNPTVCKNEDVVIKFTNHAIYSEKFTINGNQRTTSTQDTIHFQSATNKFYSVKMEYVGSGGSSNLDSAFRIMDCSTAGAERSNWCFGENIGIHFTQDGPMFDTSIYNHKNVNTNEGTLTQSDKNGNRLFYVTSDINKVGSASAAHTIIYNRNHVPMPHGTLRNNESSSQAGLILPIANDTSKYLLIKTNAYKYNAPNYYDSAGIRYSVIDMSLYGGLGGVDSTKMDRIIRHPFHYQLYGSDTIYPASEAICAGSACGSGSVFIVQNFATDTNQYKLSFFDVDGNGNISYDHDFTLPDSLRQPIRMIKMSPDGNYISLTYYPNVLNGLMYERTSVVYRWDRNTDMPVASSLMLFPGNSDACFSPNSQVYYTLEQSYQNDSLYLYQFDLTAVDPPKTRRIASFTPLYNGLTVPYDFTQMALAPDGKIYFPDNLEKSLSVIQLPNVLCTADYSNNCRYIPRGFSLPQFTTCDNISATFGLVNYHTTIDNTLNYTITAKHNSCLSYTFTNNNCYSKQWIIKDFHGDTVSSFNNTDTARQDFASDGTYFVSLIIGGISVKDTMIIVKTQLPNIYGLDTICENNAPYTFTTDNVVGGTYFWELNTSSGFVPLTSSRDATVYYLTSFKIRLTVTYPNGCSSTAIKSVRFVSTIYGNVIGYAQNFCINDDSLYLQGISSISGGNGTFSYRWERSLNSSFASPTTVASTANLEYNTTKITQSSYYRRIVISNGCPSTSNVLHIIVDSCKTMIRLVKAPCYMGDTFKIVGDTFAGGSYTWYYSYNNITWYAFTGVYSINYQNALTSDSIYVRRDVLDATYGLHPSNILLIKPRIFVKQHPKNAYACGPNDTSMFQCIISNDSNLLVTFEWKTYHNGYIGGSGALAGPIWYTVGAFNRVDTIRCYITTPCGTFQANYALNFVGNNQSPVITTQPFTTTVYEYSNATFTCVAGTSTYQFYQWQVSKDNGATWADLMDETSASLTVTAPSRCSHNWQYRCKVSSGCGIPVISNAATLLITPLTNEDVWSRDNIGDNRTEPNTEVHVFDSPDIWNRNTNDGLTGHQIPQYKKLSSNFLYTKIRNKTGGDTSKVAKLYLYWTLASTGEKWYKHWVDSPFNQFSNPGIAPGHFPKGKQINMIPITINRIPPGDSITIVTAWSPPDPAWYYPVGAAKDSIPLCFLARIVTCDDPQYGMSYLEIDTLRVNVKNNNNIITKNTIVRNDDLTDRPYIIDWITLRNLTAGQASLDVSFISDSLSYFDVGDVYLLLDDAMRAKISNGATYTGLQKMNSIQYRVNDTGVVSFNGLVFNEDEEARIGVAFTTKPLPSDTFKNTFSFHISQSSDPETHEMEGEVNFVINVANKFADDSVITDTSYTNETDTIGIPKNHTVSLSLSPNPLSEGTDIAATLRSDGTYSIVIELFNMIGTRLYYDDTQSITSGRTDFTLPTNTFTSGIYLCKVTIGGSYVLSKLFIIY